MYVVIFFSLAVIGALLHLFISKKKRDLHRVSEVFLSYLLFFCLGFGGLFAFLGHAFEADQVAAYIGWPAGNPFQFEIAMTNLGIGVLGILCMWVRGKFWLATIIGVTIFNWGAAYGHIYQMTVNNNHHPGNAGMVLYGDIIIPAILILLGISYFFSHHRSKKSVS